MNQDSNANVPPRDACVRSASTAWMPGTPVRGIIVPLVTPLSDRGRLDSAALQRLVRHILDGGVHGLFLLGTTGEAASLSDEVRRQLITHVAELVDGRVPLLVGISDTVVANSLDLAGHAFDSGADSVVATTPYFLPLEQREVVEYIRLIATESPLPVFLYNIPQLTNVAIEVDAVSQAMEFENVVGLKDSSADLAYFRSVVALCRKRPDWSVLMGPEQLLVEAIRAGAHGGVHGGANVWPRLLVELYIAAHDNNVEQIARLQESLRQLHGIVHGGAFATGVIRGLKGALQMLGICSDELAEPFAPCSIEQRSKIEAILRNSGLLNSSADG